MSTLYEMVNVYDADKWLGQFMNEAAAKDWLKKNGYDTANIEISRRRPETKRRD